MSALLMGEDRFSTAIWGGEILQQCYCRRREALTLLLREVRCFSNAIGGGKSYDTAIKGEATLRHW